MHDFDFINADDSVNQLITDELFLIKTYTIQQTIPIST